MARLQHKRGRKSNYLKSLNNPYQKRARERCLIRDNFKCKICGAIAPLEWHHIAYYINGVSILGKELENDNLKWTVMLCESFHQAVHNDINHRFNPKNVFKVSANNFTVINETRKSI